MRKPLRMTGGLVLAVAVLLTGPTTGHGQARTAEQLLDAGVAARRAGHDDEALALFTQAWERQPTARARAQMGAAEQALGQFVEAEAHLAEALAGHADAWIDERRATLEAAHSAVEARLAQLEVRVEQPGARLRVDGLEVGALPLARALRRMPGTVTIEVSADGFAPSARSVTVTAGELSRETFVLVPLTVTGAVTAGPGGGAPGHVGTVGAAPDGASGSALPLIGWIAGGVGVAGVGLGFVFYAQREAGVRAYNDDARCLVGGKTRGENCAADASAARTAETRMLVSMIGGGALLAGGLGLVLLGGGGGDAEAAHASLECAPTFGPVVGAACRGSF